MVLANDPEISLASSKYKESPFCCIKPSTRQPALKIKYSIKAMIYRLVSNTFYTFQNIHVQIQTFDFPLVTQVILTQVFQPL